MPTLFLSLKNISTALDLPHRLVKSLLKAQNEAKVSKLRAGNCTSLISDTQVVNVISVLRKKFIQGSNLNGRKGGLIAMAAVGMAISQVSSLSCRQEMRAPLSCAVASAHVICCVGAFSTAAVSQGHCASGFELLFRQRFSSPVLRL